MSSLRRQALLLRIIAAVVLLLGIFGADAIYWAGTRKPQDTRFDPSVVGYDKKQERQMGVLFGNQGQWLDEWAHRLKHPGTEAVIVAVIGGAVASGCLYVARLMDRSQQK
jgi:hypothetical protein